MATATPRESRKITYSSAIRNLKKVPFTERQKAIVIGSVLGDACLHPNWSSTNYTLKITRSEKQKAYIDWKHEQLKPFVLTAPRWYEKTHSYTLRTISHSDLTSLYREFYPDGKKILPRKIKEYIRDPLTLALWFMDDGNVRRRHGVMGGFNLNTQSFTESENEMLAQCLVDLYGINVRVERNNGYHRLAIYAEKSASIFRDLIQRHVIPSMQYKFG